MSCLINSSASTMSTRNLGDNNGIRICCKSSAIAFLRFSLSWYTHLMMALYTSSSLLTFKSSQLKSSASCDFGKSKNSSSLATSVKCLSANLPEASTKSVQVWASAKLLIPVKDRENNVVRLQGFFSKFFFGGTQNFWSPSVPDGDEVGWGVGGNLRKKKSAWSQNCPPNA